MKEVGQNMSNKRFMGDKRTYYKGGDIVYDLPDKALLYAKYSEKRRHKRFNGWEGGLERLYPNEKTR